MSVAGKSGYYRTSINHPPRPRLTLRVGVTGKRAIPESERVRIARRGSRRSSMRLRLFVADCRDAFIKTCSPGSPRCCASSSASAEGADQTGRVGCDRTPCGNGRTDRARPRLGAPSFRFAEDEFAEGFPEGARPAGGQGSGSARTEEWAREIARIRRKLLNDAAGRVGAARSTTRRCLAASRSFAITAYPNLRDVLLEHTDVLVAVSDDKNGGAGGTVDVIRDRREGRASRSSRFRH